METQEISSILITQEANNASHALLLTLKLTRYLGYSVT